MAMVLVNKQAAKAFLKKHQGSHLYVGSLLNVKTKNLTELSWSKNFFVSHSEQVPVGCCRHWEAHSSHAGWPAVPEAALRTRPSGYTHARPTRCWLLSFPHQVTIELNLGQNVKVRGFWNLKRGDMKLDEGYQWPHKWTCVQQNF